MNDLPMRQILLADDQASVRAALRLRLEQEPNFAIVGEAADATGLLLLVGQCPAELVLLDWELPGLPAIHLVRLLHDEQPGLKIIAMSSRPEAHQPALQAGATAFLSKGAPPEDLLKALASL
ncbi:response regulator transcription factor [Candidatus Chloroploca sp. Khr17]|uniref:response regulator n=1 Tax=Candidatus Chloroploca sp. Khr17 TaxID=2496869 RepID=UPI00101BCB5A|nr:response regulator transcription factor [Candidatus Chloroploca sp. Khr17]